MIEFKGAYFQPKKNESISVLVQYDGALLHVWHLADPFYHIASDAEFAISPSVSDKPGLIKLPRGGRIETDDLAALEQLTPRSHLSSGSKPLLKHRYVLVLLAAALLLMVALHIGLNGQ